MYYTDDSLLPENQDPLIITAAPYGPIWMPADSASIVGSGFCMSHQSGKPGSSICNTNPAATTARYSSRKMHARAELNEPAIVELLALTGRGRTSADFLYPTPYRGRSPSGRDSMRWREAWRCLDGPTRAAALCHHE